MYRRQIAASALRHPIATIGFARRQAEVGTLMRYGTAIADSYRRAAVYADKTVID